MKSDIEHAKKPKSQKYVYKKKRLSGKNKSHPYGTIVYLYFTFYPYFVLTGQFL